MSEPEYRCQGDGTNDWWRLSDQFESARLAWMEKGQPNRFEFETTYNTGKPTTVIISFKKSEKKTFIYHKGNPKRMLVHRHETVSHSGVD